MSDLRLTVHHSRRRAGLVALVTLALVALAQIALTQLAGGREARGDPAPSPHVVTRLAQAEASPADPATIQAIHGIINDQMAAFRRDDAAAAFNDASPFIQDRFQRPDIFLAMVRSGYAPVYRPQQVEFRDLVPAADGFDQRVFVLGPDGRAYLAHYLMQRQGDGGWKINGCILEVLDDRST